VDANKLAAIKRYCKAMDLRNDAALINANKKAHAKGAAWREITQGMIDVGILDTEIYLL
jgi:L-rhamnose mutarotase